MKMNSDNPTAQKEPSEYTSPRKARQDFLDSKRGTVKESTRRAYEYPTKHFVEFCEAREVATTGEITGYLLSEWKEDRRTEIKTITLHNNVKHLRVFLKWAERCELMERHIHEKLSVPSVPDDEAVSHERLYADQAELMLDHLETYQYATRTHAMFHTLWHTGCRASGAISLDVRDVTTESGEYMLKFRNRRSTGTSLKNGNKSERNVSISENLWTTLQNYIEGPNRSDITDDYDRDPLFTTPTKRATRQRAYKDYTALSRPCVTSNACPHDRIIDDCDAAQKVKQAFGCPSSLSLHPIRRGSITYQINQSYPKEKLSERVDVSVEVLDKHYDARTEEEQRKGRREFLDLLE